VVFKAIDESYYAAKLVCTGECPFVTVCMYVQKTNVYNDLQSRAQKPEYVPVYYEAKSQEMKVPFVTVAIGGSGLEKNVWENGKG